MPVLQARFDGRVFIPAQSVDLPVGMRVEVLAPPPPETPEQRQEWDRFQQELSATTPTFPSVEEALRHSRKRP